MTTDATELSSFFEQPEIDAQTYAQYADAAHASFHARERFDTLTGEYQAKLEAGEGDALKLALALLILGKFAAALEFFARSPASQMRHYYAAEAALGLNRFDEAVQEYSSAAQAGWDALEIDMNIAAVRVRAG